VALDGDPSATVEALLEALDALLFDKQRSDKPDAGGSPPPASAPPAAPAQASEVPAAPAAEDVARAEPPAHRFGVTLGLDSELWNGAVPGALGARAGGRIEVARGWSATLAGGILWGLRSADGVGAQVLRVLAGVDADLSAHVRLGLRADARFVNATATGLPPTNAETAGVIASARYRLTAGSWSLSAGPEVELLVRPVIVQIAGTEIFRMPTAMAGFAVEGGADFGR
jgi:hypothetical protein